MIREAWTESWAHCSTQQDANGAGQQEKPCLSTRKMLMAVVTRGLCRVNQPPPRTALEKRRGWVWPSQTPGSRHWAPSPTAQCGCLMGSHSLHSSAFSLSQSHVPSWILPQRMCWSRSFGHHPLLLYTSAQQDCTLVLGFQCSWVCCNSGDFNTYFPQ